VSRYELSVICQSAPSVTKAPTADLRISSGKLGAPSMIRTCDLLVRSQTLYPAELWARQTSDPSILAPADKPVSWQNIPIVTSGRTVVEAALARPRASLVFVLIVVPLACWVWVVAMARDMYGPMSGASAWMMTVTWDAPRIVLLWAMWAAMMAGMMLPSVTPLLMLYARAMRNRALPHPSVRIYAMALGYVAVWAAFSIGATALQLSLASAGILTMMMEPSDTRWAAALLIAAGLYQLTPLKNACLDACRSPITLLTTGWREGISGAFRMGLSHGGYCLGCCWVLMLLLFAGGVMNLTVILALTAWVAIEKLAPFGRQSARVGAALLLALGGWMALR
jgi:predicted metal-binding membrane protein